MSKETSDIVTTHRNHRYEQPTQRLKLLAIALATQSDLVCTTSIVDSDRLPSTGGYLSQ